MRNALEIGSPEALLQLADDVAWLASKLEFRRNCYQAGDDEKRRAIAARWTAERGSEEQD